MDYPIKEKREEEELTAGATRDPTATRYCIHSVSIFFHYTKVIKI